MLNRYGFAQCSSVKTPMVPKVHLSTDNYPSTAGDKAFMQTVPYLGAVGSLMYSLPALVLISPSLSYSSRASATILAERIG